MRIPVFVSLGTRVNSNQAAVRDLLLDEVRRMNLEPRTVGLSDYPSNNPLLEVIVLAKHCAGALVLGFSEIEVKAGSRRTRGDDDEYEDYSSQAFSTPWNQIEAGMAAALGLPTVVFRESDVSGGIFDVGSTGQFLQSLPGTPEQYEKNRDGVVEVLQNWRADVKHRYYAVHS